MECYTYLRNVTYLLPDGKTPFERRFGQPFIYPHCEDPRQDGTSTEFHSQQEHHHLRT